MSGTFIIARKRQIKSVALFPCHIQILWSNNTDGVFFENSVVHCRHLYIGSGDGFSGVDSEALSMSSNCYPQHEHPHEKSVRVHIIFVCIVFALLIYTLLTALTPFMP